MCGNPCGDACCKKSEATPVLGANCRAACLSKDHESWGACARDASIQIDKHSLKVGAVEADRKKDRTLKRFRDCVRAGVTPEAPTLTEVKKAEKVLSR